MRRSGRRHFLKNAAILAPVLAIHPTYLSARSSSRIRIGLIGAGTWGRQYLATALQHTGIEVAAICDPDTAALQQARQLSTSAGQVNPQLYEQGSTAYINLLARKDIDAVIIASPWHTHYTIAKAALLAGKHVACGPVMGVTVEEHLDIVHTSRLTGKQYFTLDEYSYRRDLMAVSHMISKGIFGTVQNLHAGTCYTTLTGASLSGASPYPLYPALAAAHMLGMPAGNRYVSVQAAQAQQEYVVIKKHPQTGAARQVLARGMMHSICLTTSHRQTVWLQAGTLPFSTGFKVQGSSGHWMDVSKSIYIAHNNTAVHTWQADGHYLQQYDHPLFKEGMQQYKQRPEQEGRALALHDFVQLVQQPETTAVYTAAANSLIGTLWQVSAQQGGRVISFPDLS